MKKLAVFCMGTIVAVAIGAPLRAQDRLAGLLAQYEHEADPVRKARLLSKLGDDQVSKAREQWKAGEDVASLQTLEKYRDEVRETVTGLEAAVPDPEGRVCGEVYQMRVPDQVLTTLDEIEGYCPEEPDASGGGAESLPTTDEKS